MLRKFLLAALAAALALVVAVPASAHEPSSSGATVNARRDHFAEHLLRADLAIDANFIDEVNDLVYSDPDDEDGNAGDEGDTPEYEDCKDALSDLNQAQAQTDLDSDGDVDGDDDQILINAICYYYDNDVVRGQDNGKFGNGRATRRDQAASFVGRWVDLHNSGEGEVDGDYPQHHVTDYPDVAFSNVHSGAIWWLSQGGGGFDPPIFQGYPDGLFRPSVFVRNQHAEFIEDRLVGNFAS